jgi:hypothetical protein
MKRTALILGVVATAFLLTGCEDNNPVYNPVPAAPQGVYSITADRAVEVVWNGVYDRDIDGYIVYRSFQATTGYTEIGQVSAQSNPNLDLIIYNFIDNNLTNGVTYYYAISAVDRAGQESPLSAETVFDTPRPEGVLALYSLFTAPNQAGFNLGFTLNKVPAILPWDYSAVDVYIDTANGVFYLNAANIYTDFQDVGFTASFDEVGYSPADGWSQLGYLELILGHTYVVWTRDYHYAKLRVQELNLGLGYVVFQWAYQTDTDNPELAPPLPGGEKPQHGSEYLRQSTSGGAETM